MKLLTLITSLLLTTMALAQPVETYFVDADGSRPQMTIYKPSGPTPIGGYRGVLVIHGGAFKDGGMGGINVQVCKTLQLSGYVAGSVSYRLAAGMGGKHKLIPGQPDQYMGRITGTAPDQVNDVTEAVRYLRNPPVGSMLYGKMNGWVGAVGDSCGASHASWVATHSTLNDAKVNAAAGLSGTYDGTDFDDTFINARNFKMDWLGYCQCDDTDYNILAAASPAKQDLTDASPMFLIISDGDPVMPPGQITDMTNALAAAGNENYITLVVPNNTGHAFAYWKDDSGDGEAVSQKVIEFLDAIQ